ncbi:hypothetical protein EDB85DRAFT_2141314 [Lactarius pseudohatsudake]|nr:hypothetical protein EDB85DRAFT_2141314 [Lactarius pseudohatsudake]
MPFPEPVKRQEGVSSNSIAEEGTYVFREPQGEPTTGMRSEPCGPIEPPRTVWAVPAHFASIDVPPLDNDISAPLIMALLHAHLAQQITVESLHILAASPVLAAAGGTQGNGTSARTMPGATLPLFDPPSVRSTNTVAAPGHKPP